MSFFFVLALLRIPYFPRKCNYKLLTSDNDETGTSDKKKNRERFYSVRLCTRIRINLLSIIFLSLHFEKLTRMCQPTMDSPEGEKKNSKASTF